MMTGPVDDLTKFGHDLAHDYVHLFSGPGLSIGLQGIEKGLDTSRDSRIVDVTRTNITHSNNLCNALVHLKRARGAAGRDTGHYQHGKIHSVHLQNFMDGSIIP